MIYAIGDIHGGFTQFTQLRERIESKDPDARFILIGDLVHRGKEEKEMLAWAYENITPDGKYQMVLGNHDDVFIEQYAKNEFETIFSLARETKRALSVTYKSFLSQKEGHKYAVFLAKQPLVKEVETSGKKYLLAHAWMRHGDWRKKERYFQREDVLTGKEEAFYRRMCLLWDRDFNDCGEIEEWYEPLDGEILIHGHTVTARPKHMMNRGFSPGKVWVLGSSINIDCGLGNRLSNHNENAVKYGNLAAYNMDTGEVEYLYDIPDDYPSLKEEYADERLEREEAEEIAKAAKDIEDRKKVEHLRKLFFDHVKDIKEDDPHVMFNFYDDNFCFGFSSEIKAFADFDPSKDIPMACARNSEERVLYIYSERVRAKWVAIPLALRFYKLIELDGNRLLLGMSGLSGSEAEVSIDDATRGENVLRYKINAWMPVDFEKVAEGREKFRVYVHSDGKEYLRPNGLATCDFFYGCSLYSMRVIKCPEDIMLAQITDGSGNILEEFIRSYNRYWNKG
jgi:serine/threonine protein phosphatase 1